MARDVLPQALRQLIDELGVLPGVGPRTAERYAYYLLRQPQRRVNELANRLTTLHSRVKICPITFALMDEHEEVSPLYSDERDKSIIAIVEEPLDVVALENTGKYQGTYHVLGGAISPIDGIGPEQLHIPELLERIKKDDVQELIIATNPGVEGESTALFIQNHLREQKIDVAITRLARGIPMGVDLEYADQMTLLHALEGRRAL